MAGKQKKRAALKLTATTDPVEAHAEQVDAGGLDVATQVHANAYAICKGLGVPCGQQCNLPDGLCPANWSPCSFAPPGGSGKPYASEANVTPD